MLARIPGSVNLGDRDRGTSIEGMDSVERPPAFGLPPERKGALLVNLSVLVEKRVSVKGAKRSVDGNEKGLDALIAALTARDRLSEEEIATLKGAPWRFQDFQAEEEIVADQSMPSESCVLVGGLAARPMFAANGNRQFSAVHVPGDFIDLHGLLLKVMDHGILALTPCRVAFVKHAVLKDITETQPHLARTLFMLIAIDAAIQRSWILSLGRRKAEGRMAHFFCELFVRLQVVGGATDHSFAFPISQNTLADLLGLSIVHTNRTVQELRKMGLIVWRRDGTLTILDWLGLVELAEFDSGYLNLFRESR